MRVSSSCSSTMVLSWELFSNSSAVTGRPAEKGGERERSGRKGRPTESEEGPGKEHLNHLNSGAKGAENGL